MKWACFTSTDNEWTKQNTSMNPYTLSLGLYLVLTPVIIRFSYYYNNGVWCTSQCSLLCESGSVTGAHGSIGACLSEEEAVAACCSILITVIYRQLFSHAESLKHL